MKNSQSSYVSADHEAILNLFRKYQLSQKQITVTRVGFKSYLLNSLGYPSHIVQAVEKEIEKDLALDYHIETTIEAHLLDGALSGSLKGPASIFALKNHFSYADSPTNKTSTKAEVRTVVFKSMSEEKKEELRQNSHKEGK